MENSGNFVKLSSNQETLHFCLLNIVKKLSNRRYQKKNQGEGNEAKLKKKRERERDTEIQLKKLEANKKICSFFYDAEKKY